MHSATFTRRAQVRRSELSRQRVYRSTCGRYKLIEVRRPRESVQWLAVRCMEAGEYVISRHRKRGPAEAACRLALLVGLIILLAGCRSTGSASVTATASAGQPAQVSATLTANW